MHTFYFGRFIYFESALIFLEWLLFLAFFFISIQQNPIFAARANWNHVIESMKKNKIKFLHETQKAK
jgi:hypothetical protein